MGADTHVVQVSGRLTLETAVELFGKGVVLPEGVTQVVVDLAGVGAVDSSAVSLMLSWLRAAQRKKVQLSFANTPENLLSLASLYGVDDALPLHGASV